MTADYDEKTRVTQVVQQPPPDDSPSNDCLVVIYTAEPGLLGKRFVLDKSPTRLGRGADSQIVLEGDSVSRRHAHLERRAGAWYVVDDGSTNGTYVNEEQIVREQLLVNGDRIKVGPSILKFLSGADAEAKYHEEIYRMTIVDGLTQIHNKRALFEALEKELMRARRYERDLSLLMFDIDFFKRINDSHGHPAGDFVLSELSQLMATLVRTEDVLARFGGEEFTVLCRGTDLGGAKIVAERLRQTVEAHTFVFGGKTIPVTISLGIAAIPDTAILDHAQFLAAADKALYEAKRTGRNRVCLHGNEATPKPEKRKTGSGPNVP